MSASADPLQRLLAAGQKLSNLAYHMAENRPTEPPKSDNWRAAYVEWDAALAATLRAELRATEPKETS
jgi:hypothetical protein